MKNAIGTATLRRSRDLRGVLASIVTIAAALLVGESVRAQEITPLVSTRLAYRIQPFVDMHFAVRDAATRKDALPDIAGLDQAVAAAGALDTEFGSPLAWGVIEGLLPQCENARTAVDVFQKLPETFELRGGKKIALRQGAVKLAEAYVALEPAFLERMWPAHKQDIEAANERIAKGFTPRESDALDFQKKSLAFTDDGAGVPVYLVWRAPFPGAVTHRDDDERGVCFVAVEGVRGSQLFETVLHEATHAFDIASKEGSVLARLRKELEAAGITPRDHEWRDVPHTLMFVQTGETIRRTIDEKHEHYGVAAGYYERVKRISDIELDVWKRHLDGKIDLDAAIREIVAGVIAARKPK